MDKTVEKTVQVAQAAIFVYSAIFAIKGLIEYTSQAADWAQNRYGDQSQKIKRIR